MKPFGITHFLPFNFIILVFHFYSNKRTKGVGAGGGGAGGFGGLGHSRDGKRSKGGSGKRQCGTGCNSVSVKNLERLSLTFFIM